MKSEYPYFHLQTSQLTTTDARNGLPKIIFLEDLINNLIILMATIIDENIN